MTAQVVHCTTQGGEGAYCTGYDEKCIPSVQCVPVQLRVAALRGLNTFLMNMLCHSTNTY